MTDTPAPAGPNGAPTPSLISTTLVVYVLYGVAAVVALAAHGFPPVAPLGGIVGIVAIVMAHVKRGDAAGTWLASHYRWLIRTFWFSVLWGVVGPIIAFVIWFVTAIWVLYRLIRGYVLFKDSLPVPGM
jgi:uncharacterized membrane protein